MTMGPSEHSKHEIYEGAVLDVGRHAGIEVPVGAVPKPQLGGFFELNDAVANSKSRIIQDVQTFSSVLV